MLHRAGSSPLTRGKHTYDRRNLIDVGLIPAHAGKTVPRLGRWGLDRTHPRSRGENAQCVDDVGVFTGSSPLTRGKPFCGLSVRACARLIPAHAGKTNRASRPCCPPSAHPRSRGENAYALFRARRYRGSSPLTRGKRLADLRDGLNLRLIPAHAGKTGRPQGRATVRAAHPRSRGENARIASLRRRLDGSSPLTRGKRCRTPQAGDRPRLIPAHAGKTQPYRPCPCPSRVHPLSRGENLDHKDVRGAGAGSSPLTRGKRGTGVRSQHAPRLIPAHAGKTPDRVPQTQPPRAHPRSRGENLVPAGRMVIGGGSSPLTRGKHADALRVYTSGGLIPAHAGKT